MIKWHEAGLQRPSEHEQDRSFTLSDRTTKQTRLKQINTATVTYEASRVRLPAEEEIERVSKALLQLTELLS